MNTTKAYKLASETWDDNEITAIEKIAKAQTTTMGEAVFNFEKEFAAYVGTKHAVMVNSGSSANLIMVGSLFFTQPAPLLQAGDEVIVPAVSWPTTYYPFQQYGVKLKFVDIDLFTLNYDLDALTKAISPSVRAIVAVNLLGNPNDFDKIFELIAGKDIILLEDNCESLGATYHGKQAGTFGLMGTYSFFFSHHISTMEGGMVVTDDDHLHDILLCMRAHGWTRNLDKSNSLCAKSENKFYESFRFLLPGYNLRPLEMEGAIGSEQLKKLPHFLEMRRKNAQLFNELFSNSEYFITQRPIGDPSWFGFSLVIKPESNLNRDKIVNTLINNDIECRPIVSGNFVGKETIKFFNHSVYEILKNANFVENNGFFIGNDHLDHSDDLLRTFDLLNSLI